MIVARSHDEDISVQIFGNNIQRRVKAVFNTRKAKTWPLTQWVVHQSLMLTNHFAVQGLNHAGSSRNVCLQKILESPLPDKANTRGVFFIEGVQFVLGSNGPDLRFL